MNCTFFELNLLYSNNVNFNLIRATMKITWKNVFVLVLVAAVSSLIAVGVSTYLMENRSPSSNREGDVFNQPVRMTNLSAVAAENIDFTIAAEATVHAVVHIKSTSTVQSPRRGGGGSVDPFEFFFGPREGTRTPQQPQPRVGAGSGVIISSDGYIITNNHVIDRAEEVEVTLNDNRKFKAKIIGTDSQADIALIKIEGNDFPTIPFGDSEALKVGEWVLAVGNPFNLTSTVTAGIVSAKSRSISSRDFGQIQSFIQTDAAVNSGNSGGALVNTKGELVGINTAIYSETGNFSGYSFAVPISIAGKVASDLKQYGAVQRGILGIIMQDVQSVEEEKKKDIKVLEGAYISEFAERSSAKEAGLEIGDVVIEVNNVQIKSGSALQEQISKFRPGDKVQVKIDRKGTVRTYTVELRNAQGSTEVIKVESTAQTLGAAFKTLSSDQKRQLGVSYGVEVTGVTNGKFREAGIRNGFIIMVVNNQEVSEPKDIEKIVDDILRGQSKDQGLFIKGFYPNGRTRYYAIDLSTAE